MLSQDGQLVCGSRSPPKGHRKPVHADALIPRGLVGRLSAILGCRALVLLHDAQGHPLFATTHPWGSALDHRITSHRQAL